MKKNFRSQAFQNVLSAHKGLTMNKIFLLIVILPIFFFIGILKIQCPTIIGTKGLLVFQKTKPIVKVDVLLFELEGIKLGQIVSINFDAYSPEKVGQIYGKISKIEKSQLTGVAIMTVVMVNNLITDRGISLNDQVCLSSSLKVISYQQNLGNSLRKFLFIRWKKKG